MRIRFNLKDRRHERTLILLKVRLRRGRQPFVFSTGIHIDPARWDGRRMRARAGIDFPAGVEINRMLDRIEQVALASIYSDMNAGNLPSAQRLRERLEEAVGRRPSLEFIEYCEQLAAQRSSVRNILPSLRAFFAERPFTFADVDGRWFGRLCAFWDRQGYKRSTQAGWLTVLKMVLRQAAAEGLVRAEFDTWRISIPKVARRRQDIYLTWDEMSRLMQMQSDERGLSQTRWVAIIQLFTGLRVNDALNLRSEDLVQRIDSEGRTFHALQIEIRKTRQVHELPAHPLVVEALRNRDHTFNNYRLVNYYLKELARLARIDEPVPFDVEEGGRVRREQKPKWALITSHTLRRTAITHFVRLHGLEAARRFAGHADVRMTDQYDKARPEDISAQLSRLDFFTKKPADN